MDDDSKVFNAVVRAGPAPGSYCRRCEGRGGDPDLSPGACVRCDGSGSEPPPTFPPDVATALGCERVAVVVVIDVRRGRVTLINGDADEPYFFFRDASLADDHAVAWAAIEELSTDDAARLRLGVRVEMISARVDWRGRRSRVAVTRLLDW